MEEIIKEIQKLAADELVEIMHSLDQKCKFHHGKNWTIP